MPTDQKIITVDESFDPDTVSPTFCLHPFERVATATHGHYRLCCRSEDLEARMDQMSINEWFSSQDLDNIRKDMLNGKPVKACQTCYNLEARGLYSARKRIQPYQIGEYNLNQPQLLSVDLRKSHLCNLRCAPCNPSASSAWAKELRALNKIGKGEFHHINPWFKFNPEELPHLKYIYLAGGEPFMFPDIEEILGAMAPETDLVINSNFTKVTEKHISLLKKFHAVTMIASVDGMDEYFHLMRYPGNYKTFLTNFHTVYTSLPTASISLNCTISSLNLSHIPRFFSHLKDLYKEYSRARMTFNPVEQPSYLAPEVVSLETRKRIARETQELINADFSLYNKADPQSTLLKLMNHLSKFPEASTEDKSECQNYLQWLKDNRPVARWPVIDL